MSALQFLRVAVLAAALVSSSVPTNAQKGPNPIDQNAAVAAAKAFIDVVKEGKFTAAWTGHVSQFMKQRGSQDVFIANLSMGRSNVGVIQSSRLIDVNYNDKDASSGYTGDIYSVRFLNTYERGGFYEFIVLIREADGKWRVSGLGASPAPKE